MKKSEKKASTLVHSLDGLNILYLVVDIHPCKLSPGSPTPKPSSVLQVNNDARGGAKIGLKVTGKAQIGTW